MSWFDDDGRHGSFWASVVVGAGLIWVGASYLWDAQRENLRSIGTWFVGGALALDLLVVPVAAAVGFGLRRVVPAWSWPALRAALVTSAVLLAYSWPLVTDRGGQPGNPTLRPRNYDRGLLVALVAVWVVAAVAALVARVRSDRKDAPADVAV